MPNIDVSARLVNTTGRERMRPKSIISYYSLLAGLLAVSPAAAGVRVGNLSRSYADSYNQVNGLRMGTVGGAHAVDGRNQNNSAPVTGPVVNGAGVTSAIDNTGATVSLPIRVANADLAKRIGLGETVGRVNMGTLESCSRIYPDGDFAWDTPTGGVGAGGAQTCVAVVEMRAVNADGRGTDEVLARVNLAAGDSIKCNISEFPEYSYLDAATKIEFPADREPTMDDVIAQMNKEQKQNAGLKIAAGAIIGGIGGNMAGKPERGSDSLLGTGKGKMQGAAIGALSGAAIMAGNSYAGKVGGDVILSTGVNAAAGGVMGNIMASGNSVLRVEECDVNGVKQSCLWGSVIKTKDWSLNDADGNPDKTAYYNISSREVYECDVNGKQCKPKSLANIVLAGNIKVSSTGLSAKDTAKIKSNSENLFGIARSADDPTAGMVATPYNEAMHSNTGMLVKIESASEEEGMPIRAIIPGVNNKTFGLKAEDWAGMNKAGLQVWGRDYNGDAYALDKNEYTIDNFRPLTIDAEDGGIIDISNKARMKSTLTGAGIGGAMGGFVGYQGAQSDIDQRWVSEVRNYNDSLGRVYCITGRRYMGRYNDMVIIPSMSEQ